MRQRRQQQQQQQQQQQHQLRAEERKSLAVDSFLPREKSEDFVLALARAPKEGEKKNDCASILHTFSPTWNIYTKKHICCSTISMCNVFSSI